MALRQLGSSLVAKANPGAAYRSSAEQRTNMQNLLEKGQLGTLSRQQVEEPFERRTPAGSNKVVSVRPTVESLPGEPVVSEAVDTPEPNVIAPPPGAPAGRPNVSAPGVGLPSSAPSVPQGAGNQALFRATSSPARPAVLGSRAPVQPVRVQARPAPQPKPAPRPVQTTGLRQIVQNIFDTFRGRAQQKRGGGRAFA